jgi:hypothetical protein
MNQFEKEDREEKEEKEEKKTNCRSRGGTKRR